MSEKKEPASNKEKPAQRKNSLIGRMSSAIVSVFGASEGQDASPHNFEISSPYNFKHTHHVQADPHSSTGFSGLPMPMRQVLKASGITKEETSANPQAVLDVLTFHMEGPAPPPKMPSRMSVARQVNKDTLLKKENFKKNFTNLKKLGQGASGHKLYALNVLIIE